MAKFAILETATWGDDAFLELSNDARLLFLWAWSNPQAAIGGLYQVDDPEKHMAAAVGPDALSMTESLPPREARVRGALDELRAKPMLLWDAETAVVWVINRAHYSNRSKKARDIIVLEFERCPDGVLKDAFASRYYDALDLDSAARDRRAVAR